MTRSRSRSEQSHTSFDSSASSRDSHSEFIQYQDDGQPRIAGYQYGPYAFMAPGQDTRGGKPQPAPAAPYGHIMRRKPSLDETDQRPSLPYLQPEALPLPQSQTTILTVSGSSYPRFSASPTPILPAAGTPADSHHMEINTALATARALPTTSPLTARGSALPNRQDSMQSVLSRTQSSESVSSTSQTHTSLARSQPNTASLSRAASRHLTRKCKNQRTRTNSTAKSGRAPTNQGRTVSGFSTPRTARSTIFGGATTESDYHTQHPPLPANYSANAAIESHFLYESRNPEDDDYMHDPSVGRPGHSDWLSMVGPLEVANIFTVILIGAAVLGMFCAYPLVAEIRQYVMNGDGFFGLGGTNASGQVPDIPNLSTLIDKDTPKSALNRNGFDGKGYNLVFSDEFELDGRTFYEGDDPYWAAVDMHYWGTGNYEWYDPDAVTTANGSLVFTITQQRNHELDYRSAMIQSWNQLCFTGGYIETRIQLPGSDATSGFWPGAWTMGNLGRAGFGATNEGVWPFSYDTCDVGTRPNQTNTDMRSPEAALDLSYQPGQKMSACTCKGEDHPGPNHKVGRGSPEVDIIEAIIDGHGTASNRGGASQSMQLAPYDQQWRIDRSMCRIRDTGMTEFNTYEGGVYQQCASGLTYFPNGTGYEASGGFSTYGFELVPGTDTDARITWTYNGEETWTLTAPAIGANAETQIGPRLIPEEPLYIILNLGISATFQPIDLATLTFPSHMKVDYVRVYQEEGKTNIGCDPTDRPTAKYIEKHLNAYTNANLTTWKQAGYTFPSQRLVDNCKQ